MLYKAQLKRYNQQRKRMYIWKLNENKILVLYTYALVSAVRY